MRQLLVAGLEAHRLVLMEPFHISSPNIPQLTGVQTRTPTRRSSATEEELNTERTRDKYYNTATMKEGPDGLVGLRTPAPSRRNILVMLDAKERELTSPGALVRVGSKLSLILHYSDSCASYMPWKNAVGDY